MKPNINNLEGKELSMVESPEPEGTRPNTDFPDEPFACPHCGQMLAPTVRVCASCRQPIDASQIERPRVVIPIAEQVIALPQKEQARFSWRIWGAVFVTWFLVAVSLEHLLGYKESQFVLGSVVILSSAWIFHDAHKKGIPKALRWAIGSLLLWIVVFPWYLSRRQAPKAPCPLIEEESGRVVRTLLFILFLVFLLGAVMVALKGPAHP